MPLYHGNFLKVDLNSGRCRQMSFDRAELQHYIGGATLAAALIYPHAAAGPSPLAAETPLVLATGPLSAIPVPMAGRYAVGAISPQTGFWAEAAGGGGFSFRLKGAGFDGIFITGRATLPVVLEIVKGRARLRAAEDLWGRSAGQAREITGQRLNSNNFSMVLIDAAGERRITSAAIVGDRGRLAGSCGMGALMGSKRLKGIVVAGSRKRVCTNPAGIHALARETLAAMRAGKRCDGGGSMKPCDVAQAAQQQNRRDLSSALGICRFACPDARRLCRLLNAAAGWVMDPPTLLAVGERSVNLKRAINIKLGLTRAHDRAPCTVAVAGCKENAKDKPPDVTQTLKTYYAHRGWDWETGRPSEARLIRLGLGHVARGLYPN